jgi:hypothetical protein
MGKFGLSWLELSWKVLSFCSLEFLNLVCWIRDFLCQYILLILESLVQKFVGSKEIEKIKASGCIFLPHSLI